ncbi:hypothetical protein EYF80_041927 [Liparis tanakae]|uniref:Uncharacterized protein n=1 Tax=Liparis tanakae TaxID=230148 RepID=A0A4Z2G2T2_9TELE|nr:hypothetical protein EYF80_041927 [Liparis tanakae]
MPRRRVAPHEQACGEAAAAAATAATEVLRSKCCSRQPSSAAMAALHGPELRASRRLSEAPPVSGRSSAVSLDPRASSSSAELQPDVSSVLGELAPDARFLVPVAAVSSIHPDVIFIRLSHSGSQGRWSAADIKGCGRAGRGLPLSAAGSAKVSPRDLERLTDRQMCVLPSRRLRVPVSISQMQSGSRRYKAGGRRGAPQSTAPQ